ncbi:MAG: hypothetical protein JO010_01425 [Alphaproteobacteria bacterium]|nr:hypothetical protein [Alphaproteobacteria bacterium]
MQKFIGYTALGAALALASGWLGGAASAQELVQAPEQIKACLCLGQSIARRSSDLGARQSAYEEKRRTLEALDAQVASARPRVDVKDEASIEAFKQLLDRRDTAAAALAADVSPQYQALVARYNGQVDAFNRDCSGKAYDPVIEAQVQQNLACPAE